MNIGILSKRKEMFAGKLKSFFENKGFNVKIYTLKNLNIDETLLQHDFLILKSKLLFFYYAAYYAEANNIPVIPNPEISYKQKNRIESHFLLKEAGLTVPDFYMGTPQTLKKAFQPQDFPLVLKPIMGSGSRGVKKINSIEEFNFNHKHILYLEKYIKGEHYNVYFISNEICTLTKPPLSNEHVDMKRIDTPHDIKEVIRKWKNHLKGNALFGHLDIVRENHSNKLYIVDPGSFPQFSNWRCNLPVVHKICNLILEQFENLKVNI